ncbi:MAG: hypothetical protein K5931_08920 [Lachnospiraceae bacterium]|nr:hypothetical protein [Lachnospiraceae bacterium]
MNKRSRYNLIFTVLFVFVFIIGFVIGMLLVYVQDQKEIAKLIAAHEKEISKLEGQREEITYVYVPERKRVLGQTPINSYILDNFVMEDGFMTYYDENGKKISHLGVDISYHQQNVNWDELEKAVEFVILRCGYRGYSEGKLKVDEKFREYAKECNDRGIPLGVYFYTQSVTVEEAVEEAEFVIETIKDFDISYPVTYDTEYVSDESARTRVIEISPDLRSQMAVAFCERIKEEGYYPMVYASENWLRRNLNRDMIEDYDIWAPQYLEKNDFLYDFTIWQYTESGKIAGIDTEVDLDISMVDYASFVPQLREAVLNDRVVNVLPSEDSDRIESAEEEKDDETSAEGKSKNKPEISIESKD